MVLLAEGLLEAPSTEEGWVVPPQASQATEAGDLAKKVSLQNRSHITVPDVETPSIPWGTVKCP